MNQSSYQSILKGMRIADAYAMPFQWIYEKEKIDAYKNAHYKQGSYNDGSHNPYYADKKAGEQSHYGDQLLHLEQYISTKRSTNGLTRFDLQDYRTQWVERAKTYPHFVDTSTKRAIEKGSDNSENFCGVTLSTPLFSLSLSHSNNLLIEADTRTLCEKWISMAHNNRRIIDGFHYYVECLELTVQKPEYSLGAVFKEAGSRIQSQAGESSIDEFINTGIEGAESTLSDRELLYDRFGYGCDLSTNLPMTLVLGMRYGHDCELLIQKNAELGTDCCSKALFLGAILGLKNPDFFSKHPYYLDSLTQ